MYVYHDDNWYLMKYSIYLRRGAAIVVVQNQIKIDDFFIITVNKEQ